MESANWYIFRTASRAEKKVAERLQMLGYQFYLPIYKEKHQWHDRVKEIEIPLFKGHIFIKCHYSQSRIISGIQGIVSIVTNSESSIVEIVSEEEIEQIKRFLRLTDEYKIFGEAEIQRIFKKAIPKESGIVSRYKNRYMYIYIQQCRMAMYADTFKKF